MDQKIILVDKPAGITSFDVIRILRKKLGIRKMGHAGTLDPFATGLMLIGVEEGTKELSKLIKLDKTYEAEILLGIQTDTGDITGKKLITQDIINLNQEDIIKAIKKLVGEHEYIVPKYSAIKVNGKKLYDLARKGVDFEPPTRKMLVYSAECYSVDSSKKQIIVKVIFHVASGTYIRTLGEELGKLLGVPATLVNLRRTKIDTYKVEDAILI